MKGMRPLTDQEVLNISWSFTGEHASRNRALFVLGVRTGFRISELLSLTVGDVWQDGRTANQVSVRRRHMKGKTEGRTVPLHTEAKDALHRYLSGQDTRPERPLFPSQKAPSQPISRQQAWEVLHEAYRANGLDKGIGCHGMRKTLAARMYERLGHDLLGVQEALGHQSVQSTIAYLAPNRLKVQAAMLA